MKLDAFIGSLKNKMANQRKSQSESKVNEQPTLHYFRPVPSELLKHPPLASSLQSLETTFLMIALGRFPGAVVSCASAIESAIKAKLQVPPEDRRKLSELIADIQASSHSMRLYPSAKLDLFREARNRIVHFGFSPKDDEECADLLLDIGLPFLNGCYRHLFDFYLDWREIQPGQQKFSALSESQKEKAGLLPELADQFRVARDVYAKCKQFGQTNAIDCFRSFAHFIRLGIKEAVISAAEDETLQHGQESGARWSYENERRKTIISSFGDAAWQFDCPICWGCETLVAEVDCHALESREIRLKRCICARCDLRIPRTAHLLTNVLLSQQIKNAKEQILQEFGNT